ncbi:MAG TPA: hypothetical protein VJR23_03535, partial [Candidatus Acidoferrales bacterium]|nr:hypothetical protein [Candidatus Acidoferrales bacterium]
SGIWLSLDDGAHWQSLQGNLPVAPVHDLTVHNDDLIVATHGRAFWILDDILPLRESPADVLAGAVSAAAPAPATSEAVHFFKPRLTWRTRIGGFPIRAGMAAGQNPPSGAILDYSLMDAPKDSISLEILDAKGGVIRKFTSKKSEEESAPDEGEGFRRGGGEPLPAAKGFNRFVWDLRYERATRVPRLITWGGSGQGPLVVPGAYQARLRVAGKDYTQSIEVKEDPRVQATQADLEKQLELALKIRDSVNHAHEAVNQIAELRAQLEALRKRLAGDDRVSGSALADPEMKKYKDLATAAEDLRKKMAAVEDSLVQLKSKTGEDPLNFPNQPADQMVALDSTVEDSDAAPTAQSYIVFDLLSKQINASLDQWKQLQEKDLAAFNQKIADAKIPAISLAPGKKDETAKQ